MMTGEKTQKRTSNRSTFNEETKSIVDQWKTQLKEKTPAIKITDSDLLNWCVTSIGPILSKKQVDQIEKRYFNPIKQLEWMLAQAKKAKERGEVFSIPSTGKPKRLPKKKTALGDREKKSDSLGEPCNSP